MSYELYHHNKLKSLFPPWKIMSREGQIIDGKFVKFNKFNHLSRIFIFTLFIITCLSSAGFAAIYYVAKTGNDSNAGTLSSPFGTIQKGLNALYPGDTCIIKGGTYNESLVLGQSGTSNAPITIMNYAGETVTISSGNTRVLRTGGNKHYYIVDGIRFISTHTIFNEYGADYTIDLRDSVWGGDADSNVGNNGFIIRNCYIEGAICIYGHYNQVQNCELNGKSIWGNGIWERSAASHDNIYRKNTIYAYSSRGIWSMNNTNSVLIEGNTIHDIGDQGIDCDGALHPVYNSVVRGNTVYNATNQGIQMEDAFNSIVEKNIIYNSGSGISYINYGLGPSWYADAEYRTINTNGIIRNNLVYNNLQSGITFFASPGNKVYNNTVYKTTNLGGFWGGIALTQTGGYYSSNTDIKNNLLVENTPYAIYIENPSSGLPIVTLNNNLYHNSSNTVTHFIQNIGPLSLDQYQNKTGEDLNSFFKAPGFVNPIASDFRLLTYSPAVDTGTTLAAVPDDLNGVSRPQSAGYDIGAYELPSGGEPVDSPRNLKISN